MSIDQRLQPWEILSVGIGAEIDAVSFYTKLQARVKNVILLQKLKFLALEEEGDVLGGPAAGLEDGLLGVVRDVRREDHVREAAERAEAPSAQRRKVQGDVRKRAPSTSSGPSTQPAK